MTTFTTSRSPDLESGLPSDRGSLSAAVAPTAVSRLTTIGRPDSRRRNRKRRWLTALSWSSPLVLLLVWQAAAQLGGISAQILPAPTKVLDAAAKLWQTGELQTAIGVSLGRAASGFAIGGLLGFVLGTAVGFSRVAEVLLDRSLQMVRAIPFFAIIPLVIVWFGVGEVGKIFMVSLAVFFGIYINTTLGIRQVDPKLVEMGRAANLSTISIVGNIVIPGAVPSILNGVRISLASAWLALVVAETIGADAGIGFLSQNAREFLQTDIIVLVILIYAVIGVLSDQIAKLLERWLVGWHPNFAKHGKS